VNLLLDTHAFLFWVEDSPRLGKRARRAIEAPENACAVSVATAWELAIKCSIGKLRLTKPVGRYVAEHVHANEFDVLNIELAHVARVESLPFHHNDPFDRLLAAQAIEESLTIVSADRVFVKYGTTRIW
jgi:PIN domain nuclease of toxin-antitoxin system